jgi:hypothetical protein
MVMRLHLSTLVALAALLVALPALSHTPGLSIAEFDVHTDGVVEARLTFSVASAEPLAGTVLDRDGDGLVTQADLSAARDDLRAFVAEGVDVAADGSACGGTFQGAALTETDGLELQANYACPPGSAEIQATLYYLSTSTPGLTRKGIARIVSASATTEAVLTGEHRAITLRLPPAEKRRTSSPPRLAFFAAAAVILALVAWSSRRWRTLRTTWQNRAQ